MRRFVFPLAAVLALACGCKSASEKTCERLMASPVTNDVDKEAVARCDVSMAVLEKSDPGSFEKCAACVKGAAEGLPAVKACAATCRPAALEKKMACVEACFDGRHTCAEITCPSTHGSCVAAAKSAGAACAIKCADDACKEKCGKDREDAIGACDNAESKCDFACETKSEECEKACG